MGANLKIQVHKSNAMYFNTFPKIDSRFANNMNNESL